MKPPFIVGERVYLRPLKRGDLDGNYIDWLNNPETSRYLEVAIFPQTKEHLENFYDTVTAAHDQVILAIADQETGQLIGNVKFGPISWTHRKATLGLHIGEKKFWGEGIGAEVTKLTVEYSFFDLNLRRIELGVYADHKTAVKTFKKVGFKEEDRLRKDLFYEGDYEDHLWIGLLRTECVAKRGGEQ